MDNIEDALRIRKALLNEGDLGRHLGRAVKLVYPEKEMPFSEIRSMWETYLRDKKPQDILSLYIHTPFCFFKCAFCSCYSRTGSSSEIGNYADALVGHLDQLKPIFAGTEFDNLYLGGGTPTIMKDADLTRIVDTIFSAFSFKGDGQICSEADPLTLSPSKLKMLKDHGFTRMSIGVQSFDQHVLTLNGRGHQTEEMVRKTFAAVREAGFKYINLDLVVGLYGDTPEKLKDSFKKALSVKPQKISLYALQPVKNYVDERFESDIHKFDDFWRSLIEESLDGISDMARAAGFLVPDYSKWYLKMTNCSSWSYQDESIRREEKEYLFESPNQSVVGIGENASSKISGVVNYSSPIFSKDPGSCSYVGLTATMKTEMLNFIVSVFSRKNQISMSEFKTEFGKDFLEEFATGTERLQALGVAKAEGDAFILMTDDKFERAVHVLMFFDDGDIIRATQSPENAGIVEVTDAANVINIEGQPGAAAPSQESLNLEDPGRKSAWAALRREIEDATSKMDIEILDGTVVGTEDEYISLRPVSGDIVKVKVISDTLLVREYAKGKEMIYEEKVSLEEIVDSKRSISVFVPRDADREAVLIKEIIVVA